MGIQTTTGYPFAGDVYRHHTGREYKVLGLAYNEGGDVVVVHKSLETEQLFTRSLSNFVGVMTGTMEPRFRYVR